MTWNLLIEKPFASLAQNKDGVCKLTLKSDRTLPVLSRELLAEFDQVLDAVDGHGPKGLLIESAHPKHFIVGADIDMFADFDTAEKGAAGAASLQAVIQKIADLDVPTLASIKGQCLGGGLELALACDLRLVADEPSLKLALPEVQLGLLPAGGGCARLPYLVGLQTALDMILAGKRYDVRKAKKTGLVDAACHPNQLEAVALEMLAAKKKHIEVRRQSLSRWVTDGNAVGRSIVHKKAKEQVDKNTKGFYPAPYKILDVIFKSYDKPIAKRLEAEAKAFGELLQTPESKSLIHLFDCTTLAKKHKYANAGKERFEGKPAKSIGMIGAGFMGSGVTALATGRGLQVMLSDPSEESIGKCLNHVKKHFQKKADRKKIKRFEVATGVAKVFPGLTPDGLQNTDVVVEAAPEILGLKKKILAGLEEAEPHKNWVFATNTSALPIKEIAADAKDPSRVVGMHFFSPVEKMPLLEVIRGPESADWAVARAAEIGFALGKQVIIVEDGPGFYVNRPLAFYLIEAVLMLSEGYSIEAIDKAMTGYGYPVGPLALIDEVGIDVGIHVLNTIYKAFPDRLTMPAQMEAIEKDGRLGKKNQRGFYKYSKDSKGKVVKAGPDESIYKFFGPDAKSKKNVDSKAISERLHYLFVNEAHLCFEDGIISREEDGDLGAVFGIGFPPFQGGPFHFVHTEGKALVAQKLKALEGVFGPRFKASSLIS